IFQIVFLLPTMCDLIGTTLAGIGLLYVTASVWQMLRGSLIVFTGIFSKLFLKRELKWYHWTGISVTVMGLVLVGSVSIFEEESASGVKETILGLILILAGQASNALQMVVEETFLKKRNYPPLQVVGMEGTFGFCLMVLIVLPILYFVPDEGAYTKRYEDTIDALFQIYQSPQLLAFCLLYLFSITFYNYCGLAVTKSLTAVHRTLIDACRTIVVWIVDITIFYAFGQTFGEAFNTTYGLIQIDGFMFLLIGTALYNNLFDLSFLPCLRGQPSDRRSTSVSRGQPEAAANGTDDEKAPLLGNEELEPKY
ncbi:putative solute carrier family 35 member F6, partial [Apostichopus japonicus]